MFFFVFLVCFGLLRNSSVCFGCFDIGSKHRNKPKFFIFGFTKQTETNAKQILFRFVSVRTEIYFCLFRGHPSPRQQQLHLAGTLRTPTIPAGSSYSRTRRGGGGAAVPRTANISALVLSLLPMLKSSLERVVYNVFRVQEIKHPRKESPMWI